jgi:hypothetical protein
MTEAASPKTKFHLLMSHSLGSLVPRGNQIVMGRVSQRLPSNLAVLTSRPPHSDFRLYPISKARSRNTVEINGENNNARL